MQTRRISRYKWAEAAFQYDRLSTTDQNTHAAMAEVLGLVASAFTIGGAAASAAQLSLALFTLAQTLKNIPEEIAEIAEEISLLSGSLLTLGDYITAHRDLCRPALLQNTSAILSRYDRVDKELKNLISDKNKLHRLRWCIKRPGVKILLQKLEGIKTALMLELNIIQLARDEISRETADGSTADKPISQPNRFRKTVESTVQANRQVVESVQRAHTLYNAKQLRQLSQELDVWQEDSFDTATWLYHLVFSPRTLSPPVSVVTQNPLPHQASVSDETTVYVGGISYTSSEPGDVPTSEPLNVTSKAVIVWNTKTEPSVVVDRLLSTWTTLTEDQINRSSSQYDQNKWEESFFKMIGEANEEELDGHLEGDTSNESDHDKSVSSDSDDESRTSVENPNHRTPGYAGPNQDADNAEVADSAFEHYAREIQTDQKFDTSIPYNQATQSQKHREPPYTARWDMDEPTSRYSREPYGFSEPPTRNIRSSNLRIPIPRSSQFSTLDSTSDQRHIPPQHKIKRNPQTERPPGYTVQPGYQNSHNLTDGSHSRYTCCSNPFSPSFTQPTVAGNENAVIAAIEKLLERRHNESKSDLTDPRVSKILELLVAQQENHIESEKAKARTAVEVELKGLHETREKERLDLRRLEELIVQQRDEQRKAEAVWHAERVALEEKAEVRIHEAKELTTKEIEAAHAAKKAAKKALKYARAQAEKSAQEAAVMRAEEERKKIEEDCRQRMDRYEELLKASGKGENLPLHTLGSHPVRRTHITEGKRSIEVSEYTVEKLRPFSDTSFGALNYFQEELSSNPITLRNKRNHQLHDSFDESTALLGPSKTSKNTILLSPNIDRDSASSLRFQASLAESGIEAVFDEVEDSCPGQLITREQQRNLVLRSTLFWEPPVLRLQSELLHTMKKAGWRPLYTRSSEVGQTFFLGDQPIQSYVFRPDYKPQLAASSGAGPCHSIIVNPALVEESAMEQLGFRFRSDVNGAYVLDGRLSFSDIEDLIERSFSIRETYFRRIYRQLHHSQERESEVSCTPIDDSFGPCLESRVTESESGRSPTSREANFDQRKSMAHLPRDDCFDTTRFNAFDYQHDELQSPRRFSTSTKSQSVASSSSKSTNSFRQQMVETKGIGGRNNDPQGSTLKIWDDLTLP